MPYSWMSTDWGGTPAMQMDQEELQRRLGWIEQLRAGEDLPFQVGAREIPQVIGLITQGLQADPNADWSAAFSRWVDPFVSRAPTPDIRQAALSAIAQRNLLAGEDEMPEPVVEYLANLGSPSMRNVSRQSRFLSAMVPYADTEAYKQAATQFMSNLAPEGRVAGGPQQWGAAAGPYFALAEQAPHLAEEYYGNVQFPTDPRGMPLPAQKAVRDIARGGFETQYGGVMGPSGPTERTPAQQIQEYISGVGGALQEGWNRFISPLDEVAIIENLLADVGVPPEGEGEAVVGDADEAAVQDAEASIDFADFVNRIIADFGNNDAGQALAKLVGLGLSGRQNLERRIEQAAQRLGGDYDTLLLELNRAARQR
jgi:hypothetical protein